MQAFFFTVFLILVFIPGLVSSQPALLPAKKSHLDDVVILDNEDRITGEIKKVENGILFFKSVRAASTLELDWERVRRIRSTARYEFETADRKIYVGMIAADPESAVPEGRLVINVENGAPITVRIPDILSIHEMRQSFWGRMSLSIDAGVTYTQGNQQTQINVQSSLGYVKPKYSLNLNVESLFSGQEESTNTSRHEVHFMATRYLSKRWDYLAISTFLHDAQQDLDLRTTLGGGIQRIFLKTTRTFLTGYAGFAYTRENYFDDVGSDRSNGEILTGLAISTYKFRSSELSAYALIFPSVTDAGRVRVDMDIDWKWEIVRDLFWKLSVFDNFDSRPPDETTKNNFGMTTSVGWSF